MFHGGICVFMRESLDTSQKLYVGVNLSDNTFSMDFVEGDNVLYTSEPTKVKKLVPKGSIILK